MNAKLCKKIRQFLRLTEVPPGTPAQTRRGIEYPAGSFQTENTRLKRAAKQMNAVQRHKAFPSFSFPVR